MSSFSVGDQVERVVGDRWLGTVVAVFCTIADKERVVVECKTPKVVGSLHIYSPDQLKKVNDERDICPVCGASLPHLGEPSRP